MGAIRNPFRAVGSLVLGGLAFAACESPADYIDLTTNPTLYQATGFKSRIAVDQEAFLAPLVDERKPVAEARGPLPIDYLAESVWHRPLLEMIEEIFTDELRDSGVFTSVRRSAPAAETLIVTPYLRVATCAEEEHLSGRRSLADVELRVVVHGPGEANSRTVLLDRSFREHAQSRREMSPPPPTSVFGIALRKAITKTLQVLDQSNVARSGVPMDPALTGQ